MIVYKKPFALSLVGIILATFGTVYGSTIGVGITPFFVVSLVLFVLTALGFVVANVAVQVGVAFGVLSIGSGGGDD